MTVGRELATYADLEPDEWLRLRCVSHNGALEQYSDPFRPEDLLAAEQTLHDGSGVLDADRVVALRDDVGRTLSDASITPRGLTIEPGRGRPPVGVRTVFADEGVRNRATLLTSVADGYGFFLREGSRTSPA
jgi:hypothetical protein